MAASPGLALSVVPAEGIAPLTVRVAVVGMTPYAVALDLDGDGAAEVVGPSLDGKEFTYDLPGVYFPRAVVVDATGFQFMVTSVVRVDPA